MPEDLPPSLAAIVERISPPDAIAADPPADVTGELAALLGWWWTVAGSAPVVCAHLSAPTWSGTLDTGDAIEAGIADADRAIDSGANLLAPRCGVRDDEAARTVVALLTRKEASAVLHQPAGMTDSEWMARCAAIRDRAAAAAAFRGQPVSLLASLESPGIAYLVGVLLASAARRTPCLVDGTDELAATLVADRICYRAKGWWRAGSDSPDCGRAAAIDRVDLPAGLPLGLTDDSGRGAQATLALLSLLTDRA